MKKKIYFLIFLFIIFIAFYLSKKDELVFNFNENKSYEIKKEETIDINTLDRSNIYKNGIITYNNQKIIYIDSNNNIVWENQNRNFTDKIFVDNEYVYRCINNSLELINANNETHLNVEISGEVVFVSRETNKIYIITDQKDGHNSLYILDDSNEFFVDNKIFSGIITDVSIDDKIDRYTVNTLNLLNNNFVNTISFNHLLVDSELWNIEIKDEIIMETEIINNYLLLIGTKNIYLYNEHGKLMWKNINYSRVVNYVINKNDEEIYILFEKNNKYEVVSYNYSGKVKKIIKIPSSVDKLTILDKKIFVYNDNIIYLLHNNTCDKLFHSKEDIILDFNVKNNDIQILLEDKLIKGYIR